MLTSYGNKLDRYLSKLYPDKIIWLKPKELVEQIILDPEISGIDLIITYSTALRGITPEVRNMRKALQEKHTKCNLIILLDDPKSDILIEGENIYKISVPRNFNADDIKYSIEKIMANVPKQNIISTEDEIISDMQSAEKDEADILCSPESKDLYEQEKEIFSINEAIVSEQDIEVSSNENKIIQEEVNILIDEFKEKLPSIDDYSSLEEIESKVDKNKIYKELLLTNIEFFNTNEALQVLDMQLSNVFHNKTLSIQEKISSMQNIVMNRAILKGKNNGIFVEHLTNIINNIIDLTTLQTDEEIQKMRQRIATITEKELYKGNTELISKLCDERFQLQSKMSGNLVRIVELYNHLTATVIDSQKTFIDGIPSGNPYINAYLQPTVGIAPVDLSKHIDSLFQALSDGKVKLSAVETEIRALLETSAQMCEIGENIIAAQRELIETMQAQKIEDVIIVDSLLKNCLRIYVGSDNSGKTASSVIINEIHKRKGNALLLDLTRNNRATSYLNTMENIENVIEEPNRGKYCNLYCKNFRKIDFNKLIEYLQDCATYFRFINIIADTETQIRDLQIYALSVNIFLKPDIFSINRAKDYINTITTDNIAKRICVVNPAVEPTEMFHILNLSPTEYKYVSIPNMPEITKAMLRKINPGLDKNIRMIFEEQFQ